MAGILPAAAPGAGAGVDDRSFRRLAAIMHAECGIVLGESKRNLVVARLAGRLRDLRLPDFAAYCRYLDSGTGPEERRLLTTLLTTNVTRFFRERHHFRALARDVLPPLIERALSGGRVRIWSAGCSSGQEPFSIALTLLQSFPEALRHDIRILGTDIDPEMIRLGRAAVYEDLDEAAIPATLRERYFTRDGSGAGRYRAGPELCALVTLAELNLLRDWPMKGPFDVIFCRNVVIYFDAGTQTRLWPRFAGALAPGGHLFVGHSERVTGPATARLLPAGVTQYRRCTRDGAPERRGDGP